MWAGPSPRHDAFAHALDLVPEDGGLATNYFIVPHATHRTHVYEWPNPWELSNWGLSGEDPPDPSSVDYVVLDTIRVPRPIFGESMWVELAALALGVVLALAIASWAAWRCCASTTAPCARARPSPGRVPTAS